jgi:hypothetical protein
MKITPADTSALNVEYDFVVTDDDFGNVEDFDNAGRGKNQCSHRDLLRASRSFYDAYASGLSRDDN